MPEGRRKRDFDPTEAKQHLDDRELNPQPVSGEKSNYTFCLQFLLLATF